MVERRPTAHVIGRAEWVFFAWAPAGLGSLWPVSQLVEGTFPALTVVWLLVPLAALAMPQPQGFFFAGAYAFAGIGLIGG